MICCALILQGTNDCYKLHDGSQFIDSNYCGFLSRTQWWCTFSCENYLIAHTYNILPVHSLLALTHVVVFFFQAQPTECFASFYELRNNNWTNFLIATMKLTDIGLCLAPLTPQLVSGVTIGPLADFNSTYFSSLLLCSANELQSDTARRRHCIGVCSDGLDSHGYYLFTLHYNCYFLLHWMVSSQMEHGMSFNNALITFPRYGMDLSFKCTMLWLYSLWRRWHCLVLELLSFYNSLIVLLSPHQMSFNWMSLLRCCADDDWLTIVHVTVSVCHRHNDIFTLRLLTGQHYSCTYNDSIDSTMGDGFKTLILLHSPLEIVVCTVTAFSPWFSDRIQPSASFDMRRYSHFGGDDND